MPRKVFSSANSMVWEYYAIIQRLTARLDPSDEKAYRQDIALCILLAVTAVESFFNLFFQVLVTRPEYSTHDSFIQNSLKRRHSLEYKINHWPKRVFNKHVDMSTGVGKRFAQLKDLRNKLMHFGDVHRELDIAGTKLHNFTDTTFYQVLEDKDAWKALHTSLLFIVEVLKLVSKDQNQLAGLTVQWTTYTLPVLSHLPYAE
jgi:hypothetical protein